MITVLVPVSRSRHQDSIKNTRISLGKHTSEENWEGSGLARRAIRPCNNLMPGERKRDERQDEISLAQS